MIILGVDPGTLITGYGVIETSGRQVTMLHVDVVRNKSSHTMPIRLKTIYDRLCEVIETYHPDEFAIETAFYGKNAQSALKIGHARGVSILAAVNREIPTAEYAPREVKKAVTGNGGASKEQVQFMVRSILRLKQVPKAYDASDALAVALCHWYQRGGSIPARATRRPKQRAAGWTDYIAANPHKVARHP